MSYFIFSLEKILSHSLTPFRDLRYFFFPDPEKKNTVQKFQIIQVWPSEPWWTPTKMTKKWSYGLHFRKNTNPHHVIGFFCHKNGYRGFTKRIFFFRESWEREKKNTAIFTHSLLFWDFHPKSIFSREKKIQHLCWILPILGLLIIFDKFGFQQTKHILCSFYSCQLKVGQLTNLLDNYPSI